MRRSTRAIRAGRCSTWTARWSASTRRSSRAAARRWASALPCRCNLARPVVEQLAEFGETRRGWLGVGIQEVTDEIAASLGRPNNIRRAGGRYHPGGPCRRRRARGRHHPRVRRQADRTHARPAARSSPKPRSARRSRCWCCATARRVTLDITLGRLEEGETDHRRRRAARRGARPSPRPTSRLAPAPGLKELARPRRRADRRRSARRVRHGRGRRAAWW